MYAFAAFSVALLAGQASVYALGSHSPVYTLLKRQSDDSDSDVPEQCQSLCEASLEAASSCTGDDESCLCSSDVVQTFTACFSCEVSVDPSLEGTEQSALSELSSACEQAGFNVGDLSLSTAGAAPLPTTGSSGSKGGANPGSNGAQPAQKNGAVDRGAASASVLLVGITSVIAFTFEAM
ncbi:hypothetical protein OBBRIDRAFT_793368 [Obba rivulosa]|uniref:Extracellular membrane protein CFEM domain-containing protein n=1 Tax=Obba rivulosa TaxID=1052685 RepID=A0A8E2AU36_9APHY|nr:hypothetical protein OBBRIDRAFT_793368 [Obba rivulosa]